MLYLLRTNIANFTLYKELLGLKSMYWRWKRAKIWKREIS